MHSRTNTGKRLVKFATAKVKPDPSTVFSQKKLKRNPHGPWRRLSHQLEDRLIKFRENPLRTAAEKDGLIREIKEVERTEIASYTDKHAPLRLQIRLSNLRGIIEELRECQDVIGRLNIQKNFIPTYLKKSSNGDEKHLRHEENLRQQNSRCRTVMSAAWKAKNDAERQQHRVQFIRGLSDAGAVKKRRTRRIRRPKRQTIRPRRKKRKSKMTRFWRDRRYDKIKF